MDVKKKVAIIGPVYPYKSGIAHYTGLLSKALEKKFEVAVFSYSLQYPKIMFKREQKDYENKTFQAADTRYIINTANPFNWPGAKKKILDWKPDMLIVHWWHPYFAPCYQAILSGMKKKFPVIFVCHNVLPHERFPMDRMLTKNTLKLGTLSSVHSKEDASDLEMLLPNMPYKRTVVPTYNAFKIKNLTREEARGLLGLKEDEQMLLFFGIVRKYKGLKYLIKAVPDIVKKLPAAKIYVVGDFGGQKEEYDALMKECNTEGFIRVYDEYVPDNEIEKFFAAADLNICPYVSATQSAIVQIAFGFGLPVIATNVGGLPEAVTDGKTGIIVPSEDEKALASAIVRFFEEDKADEFRANIAAEAERFSWDRTSEIVEELFAEYGKQK